MYNFDQIIDRRNMSQKWDQPIYPVPEGTLTPMWVADMDFAIPDCVLEGMRKRLEHPTMGYFRLDDRFYEAIIHWNKERRGVTDIEAKHILYQNSTVGAVVSAMEVFTNPGDAILLHLPVYPGFTHALSDNGRRLIGSALVQDADGIFRMDMEDMERKIVSEGIKCFIFCSPHNPTGRVWTREEVKAVAELCEKHDVKLIADEIWADFVFAPFKHIHIAQFSSYTRKNTVSTYGATKTFNLAGLRIAYSIVYDEELGAAYKKAGDATHYNLPNVLSVESLIAGYNHGEEYVEELLSYIRKNMLYCDAYVKENIPGVKSYLPEGTYTMWLSLKGTGRSDEENMLRMSRLGLVASPATDYSCKDYFRLNLGCPLSQLKTALEKLKAAME